MSEFDSDWDSEVSMEERQAVVLATTEAIRGDGPLKDAIFAVAGQELTRKRFVPGGFSASMRSRYLRDGFMVTLAQAISDQGFSVRHDRELRHQLEWFENPSAGMEFYFALGNQGEGFIRTAGRGPQFDQRLGYGKVGQGNLFPMAGDRDPRVTLLVLDPRSEEDDPILWVAGIIRIDQDDNKLLEYSECHRLLPGSGGIAAPLGAPAPSRI